MISNDQAVRADFRYEGLGKQGSKCALIQTRPEKHASEN
jgi:hypothetical protein